MASAPRSPTRRRTHPSRGCGCRRHRRRRSVRTSGRWIRSACAPPTSSDRAGRHPSTAGAGHDDYNEVKKIGSATSATRTADQTLAARFWGEAPVQQARGSFRRFVLDHQLDIVDAARFNAMWSVTYADALIACFDAKYTYTLWRPITAIRAGDTDGNDATAADPAWATLLAGTPNHPEYPSAHSCITPAGGRVIARFLHTPADRLHRPQPGHPRRSPLRQPSRDLTYEVGNARIWGGIHFRSAVDDGVKIGTHVANWVLAHHFHRSHD